MLYPEAGTVIYGCGKAANCDSYQCVESERKRSGWCSSEWQGCLYVLMDVQFFDREKNLSTFITFTPPSRPNKVGAHLNIALFIWYMTKGHVTHKEHRVCTF